MKTMLQKRKGIRRALCFVLALAMCISLMPAFPITAQAAEDILIDRLVINYSLNHTAVGTAESELVYEVADYFEEVSFSTGSNGYGVTCCGAYLYAFTGPDLTGTRKQILRSSTDRIDPNLHYYALIELQAKYGYDFKHTGDRFDDKSVTYVINGTEMTDLSAYWYYESRKGIDVYVPIEIALIENVYDIAITNPETVVAKNSMVQFTCDVQSYGIGYDSVVWTVEGAGSTGTTIDYNGLLTVADDETADSIIVKATSAVDSTIYATRSLSVLDKLTIDSVALDKTTATVTRGSDIDFTATVVGNDKHDTKWTLTGNNDANTKVYPNANNNLCKVRISADETATELTLTATSVQDPTKSATSTIIVKHLTYIDRLAINYTAYNAIEGFSELELVSELKESLYYKDFSNGSGKCVAYSQDVTLYTYTGPNRTGTRTQVRADSTNKIDPNLYYYVGVSISAYDDYDFKHFGDTLEVESVTYVVNGVEMTDLAALNYIGTDKKIFVYIPIPITRNIGLPELASGKCGEDLTWSIRKSTGELVISGTGAMYDYDDELSRTGQVAPWHDYKEYIKTVVIEEGVSYIGDYAFDECSKITEFVVPWSVKALGNGVCDCDFGMNSYFRVTYYGSEFQWKKMVEATIYNTELKKYNSFNFRSYSNQCGDNVYWNLNTDDMKLIIYGTGPMYDSYGKGLHFTEFRNIKEAVIEEGVTTIGEYAFLQNGRVCDIKKVYIAASVKEIKDSAFYLCYNLQEVTFAPDSQLKTIEMYAFADTNMKVIGLPEGLETIGDAAFYETPLVGVHIPFTVKRIEASAFVDTDLTYVIFNGTRAQWNDIYIDRINPNLTALVTEFKESLSGTITATGAQDGTMVLKIMDANLNSVDHRYLKLKDGVAKYSVDLPAGEYYLSANTEDGAYTSEMIPVTASKVATTFDFALTKNYLITLKVNVPGCADSWGAVIVDENRNGNRVAYGLGVMAEAAELSAYYKPGSHSTMTITASDYATCELEFDADADDKTITVDMIKKQKLSHTLSVQNNLAINYYVAQSAIPNLTHVVLNIEKDVYDDAGVKTVETSVLSSKLGDFGHGIEHKFVYEGVASYQAINEIRASLTGEYNGVKYTFAPDVYSIETYCYNQIGKSSVAAKTKKLLVDLLNYCSASQVHFGIKADTLANRNLTSAQKALGTTTAPALANISGTKSLAGATAKFNGKTLVLGNNVDLKIYMLLDSSVKKENVRLRIKYQNVNGENVVAYVPYSEFSYDSGRDEYSAKYSGLIAPEFRKVMQLTIMEGDKEISDTDTYSIETYAYNRVNGSSKQTLKDVVTEMMKYSDSALAYFK